MAATAGLVGALLMQVCTNYEAILNGTQPDGEFVTTETKCNWNPTSESGVSVYFSIFVFLCTRQYPKVSGLAAWSKNCRWYSSLPLGAFVSLFCEVSLVSFAAITLCVASQRVFVVVVCFVIDSVRKFFDTPSYWRE
jgi:hypothetical protein